MRTLVFILLSAVSAFAQPFTINDPAFLAQANFVAAGGAATTTVNLWQDFEFATVSDANLAANDHCADGTWTVDDAGSKLSTSASGETATLTAINGSSDSGTNGLAYDHTGGTTTRLIYTFGTSKTSSAVSYGFWYKSPPISSNIGDWAIFQAGTSSGNAIANLQVERESGTFHLRIWGADIPAFTNITANTLYWMTIKMQQSATCSLSVYSSSGSLVATSSCTGANYAQERLVIVAPYTRDVAASAYYDDFVVDWTDATYPLGIP